MRYPGHVIKTGESDARLVKALKTALNRALALRGVLAVRLDPDNPRFGRGRQARGADTAGAGR